MTERDPCGVYCPCCGSEYAESEDGADFTCLQCAVTVPGTRAKMAERMDRLIFDCGAVACWQHQEKREMYIERLKHELTRLMEIVEMYVSPTILTKSTRILLKGPGI